MNRITEKRITLRKIYQLCSDSETMCYQDWLEKKLAELVIKTNELINEIKKLK